MNLAGQKKKQETNAYTGMLLTANKTLTYLSHGQKRQNLMHKKSPNMSQQFKLSN